MALEVSEWRVLTMAITWSAEIVLEKEDILIQSEDIPGWTVATEGGITVALDINITDELQKEGIARDFVNRIQNLRKDQGLDVQDKIKILVKDEDPIITTSINANQDYICAETQALTLEVVDEVDKFSEMDIDAYIIRLRIDVVKPN